MNMRTALGTNSNLSNDRFATAIDEKLAFIDRVCSLLLESRFETRHSYAALGDFIAEAGPATPTECSTCRVYFRPFIPQKPLTDLQIETFCDQNFTPPRTARPTALPTKSSFPAARISIMGVRESDIDPSSLIGSAQPRGSPAACSFAAR